RPASCQVSQSCGSATAATRAATAGSLTASQRNLVTVNDGTGTLPIALAHCSGAISASNSSVALAERVSFHNSAGRTTSPCSSRQIMPCCCPATDTASTSDSPPARSIATVAARHHSAGCTSVPSGWGACPSRTSVPSALSRMTTLHDWVDESIPATRLIPRLLRAALLGPRTGLRCSRCRRLRGSYLDSSALRSSARERAYDAHAVVAFGAHRVPPRNTTPLNVLR